MIRRCYTIYFTPEYNEWLEQQPKKEQYQIEHRIAANKNGQDKDIAKAKNIYLKRKKISIEDFEGVKPYNSVKRLLDKKFVGAAILECLSNNDPEGVMETIEMYLTVLNKTRLAKANQIPRSTLYHSCYAQN